MKAAAHLIGAMVLVLALSHLAQAEVEPVFTPVPPGPDGVTLLYTNLIPPAPDHKNLRFFGAAESNGFPGLTSVSIQFDWLLPGGGTALSPPMTFPVLPLIGNPVDTGTYLVDFCPTDVSLHFVTDSPAGMSMSGSFEHTCIPVPEPATAMVVFAAAGMGLIRRPRRHFI
ncbi:MAG TPA: PEP-CTERM sorting domain-containing protein [Tepidisphaeraceae bacterium]|jgi:hypothetical protein|nr:PEP-CTERM sorting domain-containing protein [Tepidisphaeraceae bacterium]